jgi:filamentous hemagglutinin family protein
MMPAPRRRSRLFTTSAFGALALAAFWAAPAQAQLVQGATPAQSNGAGPAIDQSVPNTTTVTLGGSRTVIDWDKFDINSGDTANFVFANRSDIVLNRVGGAGSTINGNLNGTIGSAGGTTGGNIWIYNANGVVVGANARITTGGLLVTTAAVDRATDSSAGGFLDGNSTQFGFTGAATDAGITVQNGAQITSHGGAIALVSTSVTTEAGSSISAQDGGNVLYGAAAKYKISFRPTGTDDLDLLSFEVASGADGSDSTANGGDLLSLGGNTSGNRVFAALVSKTNVFSRLLSTGTITATSAALDETGAIVLTTNHEVVNGTAATAAVANNGGADIALGNNGASSLTAPAITMLSSDSITSGAAMSAVGGTVDLKAENGVLWGAVQGITAGTLTAQSASSMSFSGSNAIDKVGGLTAGGDIYFYSFGTNTNIAGDIVSPGEVNLNVSAASGSGIIRASSAMLSGEGAFNLDSAATLNYVYAIDGDLTVNSTGDLNLALANGTANDLGNKVILNATSGAIHQVAGGGVLIGNVVANARDGIDLGQDNQFTSIEANSTGGGSINLTGSGGFGIAGSTTGTMTVTSPGTVTAGGVLNIARLDINAAAIDLNRSILGTVGFGDLTTTSGDIAVTTDSTVSFSGTVTAANGHDVSVTSNLGTINQTAGTITGRQVYMLASAGSILQNDGATIVGTGLGANSFVAGDDLILAGSNQIAGYASPTFGWGTGSDLTYRSAYGIYFDGGATPIGALTLIADQGGIQQGNVAFTADSLTASALQDIDFGTSANNSIAHLGNISSSTGEVRLRIGANAPLSIDGAISSGSRVIFTARGAVSGSGTIAAPQTYLDIQSGGTVNIAGSTTLIGLGTGSGDLTVNATGGLAVNANAAGNGHAITLNAAGGDIIQTGGGGSSVSLLSLIASGDISFGAGSYFTDILAQSTGGGDISLNTLGGTSLQLDTTGDVSLSGDSYTSNGVIRAGTLTATVDGNLTLDTTIGGVGSFGALHAGGDIALTASGDLVLANDLAAGVPNLVSLTSTGGAIIQNSGTITANWIKLNAATTISQASGATLNSYALSLASGGNVALGEANDFTRIYDLAVGGDLTLRNRGSIDMGPLLSGYYSSGGALTLTSDTGIINSTSAGIVTSRLTATAAGYIFLDGTIASLGDITAGSDILLTTYSGAMTLTGNVTGGTVSLYADDGVGQSGGIIDASRLNVITNGAISLTGANAIDVVGRLDTDRFSSGTGHDVTLHNAGAIVLDYLVAAAGGTVTLTADSGGISQTSSSVIAAGMLKADAVGDLVFDQSANTIVKLGAMRSASGNITFGQNNGFDIYGDISAATGTVSFVSNGAIETYSGHLSAGTLIVSAGGEASFASIGNIKLGTIDTSGGGVFAGGNFYLGGDGDIELTDAVNTGGHNLNLYTSGGAITRNGGTISVDYMAGGGVTYATAAGSIDLASVGTAVIWATSTGGGNINLSGDSDIGFKVDTTGDLTVTAGGWAGNNSDVIARSVGISAGTGISLYDQTVTIDVGSYRYLTVADGYIDIENKDAIKLDGDVIAGGGTNNSWIHLNSTQAAIQQNSGAISGYSVALQAVGAVTQDASARIIAGDGGLSFTGTDVSLIGANEFGLNPYSVSGDLTLRNLGTIDLRGGFNQVANNGDLTLTSDTGSILGSYLQTNKLTATATNGTIVFQNSAIGSLGAVTAGARGGIDVDIESSTSLVLTDTVAGGSVLITANGNITQSGGGIVSSRLSIGATGDLLLGGANDFVQLNGASAGATRNLTLRNRGDIAMAGASQLGTLTLISDQGSVSQSFRITANTLNVQAATGINLSESANDFTTVTGLSVTGGDIRLVDTGGFAIDGNIVATGGTVTLTSIGSAITTTSGKIDADTLVLTAANATLAAADDIKLGNVSISSGFTLAADGSIDLAGVIGAVGMSLSATTGAISQSGGYITATTGSMLAAGNVTLGGGNTISSTFNGTSTGGGTIAFNNAGSGGIVVNLNTTGNAVVTVGGNLSTSGITADSLSVDAGHIDLTNNVHVNSFTRLVAAYGDVLVTNAGSFTVAGDVSASKMGLRSVNLWANGGGISQTAGTISANDVTLRGTGDMTQSGTGRIDANASILTGANIDLMGANSFGSGTATAVRAGGTVKLNSDVLYLQFMNPAGDVTLTADGNITLTSFGLQANSLTAHAGGQISMSNGVNSVGTIHGLSGTNVTFTGDTVTIDGDVTAEASNGIVSLTADSGDFSQTAGTISGDTVNLTSNNGSVLQSGTGRVVANALAVTAHAGNIDLAGANDFNGAASGLYWDAGSDVWIHNSGSIVFNGGTVGALNLFSDNGAITQTSAVTASSFNAGSATGVTFNQMGNAIAAVGILDGGTGNVTFRTSVALNMVGDVSGASVTLIGSDTITQNAGTITTDHFTASGTTVSFGSYNHVGGIEALNASTGAALFNNDESLLINGHVIAATDATLVSHFGSITGPGYIQADTLRLQAAQGIMLENGTTNISTLALTAGGDVSIADLNGFAISSDDVDAGSHAVTFDLGVGTLTPQDINSYITAGRLNLRATGGGANLVHIQSDLTLGDITLGAGTLNVDGPAVISLAGDILTNTLFLTANSVVQTGGTLTASGLTIYSGGNITLDRANAVAHLGNITALGNGDIVFRNAGDVDITGAVTATGNAVTLRSDGGAVWQNGGTITADSLLVSASTGIELTATVGTLKGLTSTTGGIGFTTHDNLILDGSINSGAAGTTLNIDGNITQNSGIITAGMLNIGAAGDVALTQANQVQSLGPIDTGVGYFHFTNAGGFTVGGYIASGSSDVALTAGGIGSITQTGSGISTQTLTLVAGGDLIFDGANFVGLFNATAGNGGTITLRNQGNLLVKAITAVNGTVNLTSNTGSVGQQVVPGFALWTGTLNANAATDINLSQYNFVDTLGDLSAAGSIRYNAAGTVMLGGNIQAGGTLAMEAGGYIGQPTGMITADHLDLNATGIALTRANDIGSTNASNLLAADDITFHSANGILLGTVSTPGLLSLTAGSGDIQQTVALSADRLDASAVAGDIVLDQANTIGTLNDVTAGGGFTLRTGSNLTLDGQITAPDLVKLTAGGNITQIGVQAIYTDVLAATSGAGATNGISLLNHNQVGQATLNSNGKDLRFRNTGDFALGNINAAGHIVEMISDTGSVTQLAGTSITAGTFSATGTNVVLDNTGNQISRIGLISTGSDLSLRNGVALQIDAINAGNHDVTINNGADITGGNITADRLTVSNASGVIDLTTANHVNSIGAFSGYQFAFTNAGSFTVAGAINNGMYQTYLTSLNGSISMAGGAINSGGLTVQAATGISLTGNMSNLYGATTSTGDVSILSSALLQIDGDVSGDTVTLNGTGGGGFVGQVSGSITANRLNASGSAYVDLNGATNHIASLGTLSSGDDVVINSLDAVTLTGNIDAGDVLALTAGGPVSQTGGRIQSFSLDVTAATGAISLGLTNQVSDSGTVALSGADISFKNDGSFTLGNVDANGALTLTSVTGSIGQANGTAITADILTATAGNSLGFGQINHVGALGRLAAGIGFVVFTSGISYDLTDDISSGAGGFVSLGGVDAINQTGGTITADSLNIDANRAYLERSNHVGQLGFVTVNGDFIFRNADDIEIWGTIHAGTLGLRSDTGSVTNPGALFTADTLDVTAAGNINLNGGSFNYLDHLTSQNGDITLITSSNIFGGTLISAANGTVDLTVGRITADAVVANLLKIDATGGDIELTGNNDVAHLGNILADNISLAVGETDITGWLHGANSVAFVRSGIASDFALTMGAGGAITTNMISLGNTGTAGTATLSNITTGSGTLELNVNFNGDASVTANTSAISLNNALFDGDLTLIAGDAVTNTSAGATISGTINAVSLTGDVSLQFGTDSVGHFGNITAAGYAVLGAASVDLTGAVQSSAGAVALYASNGSVTQAAGSSIDSTSIAGQATGGDFLLAGTGNSFTSIGAITADGDITLRGTNGWIIRDALSAGGALSLFSGSTISVDPNGQTLSADTLNVSAPGAVDFTGVTSQFAHLGTIEADSFALANTGNLDLAGNQTVAGALSLTVDGWITQSAGIVTADTLILNTPDGFALDNANLVNTLVAPTYVNGSISFTNDQDVLIDTNALQAAGDVTLNVNGDLTAANGIFSGGAITLTANGVDTSLLTGDGGVTVNGGAHALNLGQVSSGDDVSVTGTGLVSVTSLDMLGADDWSGDGFNILLSGGDVRLGADGGAIGGSNYLLYAAGVTPGSVAIVSSGDASIAVGDMNAAVDIDAIGDVNAESQAQLLLGTVSGANVTLLAAGNLQASSIATPGIYSATAADFNAGAFQLTSSNPLDILITDTDGDLTLSGNLVARRNTIVTSLYGDVLGSTARLGAGLTMDGTLTVNGFNIALLEASSLYDVTLNGQGTVDIGDIAYAGRSYTLKGDNFLGSALVPIGTQTGSWHLISYGDLDIGGQTLVYAGGIDFDVRGLLSNGTIQSLSGAVTGSADTADVYALLGATEVAVSSTVGAFEVFQVDSGTGRADIQAATSANVSGSIVAGTDVRVRTSNGDAVAGDMIAGGNVTLFAQGGDAVGSHASAGGNITIFSSSGDAILRQATLTGTTGDLVVQSNLGNAVLGADDYAGIASDNYFERAAGSTGATNVWGTSGAFVNLDHTATLDEVSANSALVNVLDGNLTIGLLRAFTNGASAYVANGSLFVDTASGATVDLHAEGGNLTLGGGGIGADAIYLNADGTVDTTAVGLLEASNYLSISGGNIVASSLLSGGDIDLTSTSGGITIDEIGANGDATASSAGNLAINQISLAGAGGFDAGGTATVRDMTAAGGFFLTAQGNVTLGADAGAVAGLSNTVDTGGTLSGCGCSGGGTVLSFGGDVTINLYRVTGVLDTAAAYAGDVSVAVTAGDLGINVFQGHNLTASAPGMLTIMNAVSSGGSYTLTAADFGGSALISGYFGGASSMGDVTIIDTDGDLDASGWLNSAGNIHIEAQDGAITGTTALVAQGDITAIGQGVSLDYVTGRDVTIDAGAGVAAVASYLSVDGNYTLTGGDFGGYALTPGGAMAGSLTITDTVGDFDFGGSNFAFGGAITIDASHGLLAVNSLQAGSAISLTAGGNLSLASATLTDTGSNALSLTAGGDLVFGASNRASIAGSYVFSHASPTLAGTSIHADGNVMINLYQADGLGAIDGGTVEIAVSTGDFSAGNIDAAGAITVQGPSGTLRLGDVTAGAGNIDISGQGNTTLGNVSGNFAVNLLASAGNLTFGTLTGGDVSLMVAGGISGSSVSASTLGVVAVTGNANLDNSAAGSHVGSLGAVNVGGDFALRNLADLSLDGVIEVGGLLDLQVAGALIQNAYYIVADRLQGNVTGAAMLGGDNRIGALGSFSSTGLKLSNATAMTIDGAVQANGGAAVIASHGGLTISANGSVSSSAAGDAITLASDGLFTNLAGAGALGTPNGRWLVYTQTGGNPGQSDPNNDFGGLAGTSYYGDAYSFGTGGFASAPNAGNRFVYGYRPVLTVTPSSLHLVYDGTTPQVTTTITGLVHGDSAANAWSGAADVSGVGSDAGTYFAYSAIGTLASEMNYAFAFTPGTVIIDPRVISAVLNANDRTYDGTTNASGTLTLNGVIAGDTVAANAGNMSFDSRNAGTRTVTAGGITLSGASAGNYIVSATATDLADILARAITATLTANDRTYDGTTNATGSLGLNGLLGNDDVSVAGASLAFDSRNAGTRTVNASGITLTGADASNYTVSASATDLAEILARAIAATLTANDRTYDGTTAATGTLGLSGVLGNDQVTANGNLTFDSRNAGIGRTVTANGISLSGSDADNYTVNASATDLADILARAITATLTANDRTYDGTLAATGTLGLTGLVSGDAVSAGAGGMAFDNGNAGTGRTVTASGITLSGADAGNYMVNASATDLADILARAITAMLTANGRVYDGTTIATGTLALNGVLSGDQVSVSAGGIAFDSRSAGTRTATASGLTLGGANAANYTITGTASGSAVISPRAITGAASADSRVYDGTTNATGRIALTGVISGDTVSGIATYRFADANAGTGRTVQVSGLGLSGADAANYTLSLSATPVTADITRRAVTVTINDATKILGQPDPAFGYAVSSGSVVNGDSFAGAPVRAAGGQVGRYAIGQGTLALSANYLLTVIPGTLVISLTQSGADASDALKMLQDGVGIRFSVNQDPSRNLEGDGGQGSEGDGDK